MINDAIKLAVVKQDLSPEMTAAVAREIMTGKANDTTIAAFLTALRMKGETADEIASFVQVMREFCHRISPKVKGIIIDTCGTGGDKLKTFNISTIAAFIAAGADIPVAKHGNRSVTSKCGSADILEAMGININISPSKVEKIIENVGIGFMFAPRFHPAMKHVQQLRRQLGIRTIFNILGPMTNPAFAQAQVIGVYDKQLLMKVANALKHIGLEHVLVVNGNGMDEISTLSATDVVEVSNSGLKNYVINPSDFGIKKPNLKDLQAHDIKTSVRFFKEVLEGNKSPRLDIVLLNAAAAMVVGGKAMTLQDGFDLSYRIVQSGKAKEKFEQFREESLKYEA
jgi:anthranilate phosphoribosyltransferase